MFKKVLSLLMVVLFFTSSAFAVVSEDSKVSEQAQKIAANIEAKMLDLKQNDPKAYASIIEEGDVLEATYNAFSIDEYENRVIKLALIESDKKLSQSERAELLFAHVYAEQNSDFKSALWNALYGPGGVYYGQGRIAISAEVQFENGLAMLDGKDWLVVALGSAGALGMIAAIKHPHPVLMFTMGAMAVFTAVAIDKEWVDVFEEE